MLRCGKPCNKSVYRSWITAIFLSAWMALPSYAQTAIPDDPNLKQLARLVAEKQNDAAYELSNSLMEEWGGEPYFDFLAGRAAFNASHFQEAVFAFERVLINEPKQLAARVLAAFSYFKVNNYGAAKVELTKLLNVELPAADREKVVEYLAIISEQEERATETSDLSATLGFTFDSNVNSGTLAEEFFLPGLDQPIILDDASRERHDNVTDLTINYAYTKKITQRSGYNFGVMLNDVGHEAVSNLDRSLLNLSAGYFREFDATKISVSGYYQPMQLNDELYRVAYGASIDATWSLSEKWQLLLGVGYTQVDNKATDTQDMDQYSAKSRFTYLGDSIHMFELSIGDDEAKLESSKFNGRYVIGLNYTYLLPISQQWTLSFLTVYQDIEHDAEQAFFLVVREEESLMTALNLDYTPDQIWRFSANFSYSDKTSNINIYEYDRSAAKFSATRKF